tara:strand:+ start:72 stop:422 length:351 start_codon:yes stop_codon:yes gene_type:complete
MPSYTLKCKECNYIKDYIVQIRDGVEDKHYCPKCFLRLKSVLMEREFNPPKNLIINGSKNKKRHTGDKKINSEFEQHANDIYDENEELNNTQTIIDVDADTNEIIEITKDNTDEDF